MISETTQMGKIVGTLKYMSPEQIKKIATFKSDIWAFGCVMLEYCVGIRPFEGLSEAK